MHRMDVESMLKIQHGAEYEGYGCHLNCYDVSCTHEDMFGPITFGDAISDLNP